MDYYPTEEELRDLGYSNYGEWIKAYPKIREIAGGDDKVKSKIKTFTKVYVDSLAKPVEPKEVEPVVEPAPTVATPNKVSGVQNPPWPTSNDYRDAKEKSQEEQNAIQLATGRPITSETKTESVNLQDSVDKGRSPTEEPSWSLTEKILGPLIRFAGYPEVAEALKPQMLVDAQTKAAIDKDKERRRSTSALMFAQWYDTHPGVTNLSKEEFLDKVRTSTEDYAIHNPDAPAGSWLSTDVQVANAIPANDPDTEDYKQESLRKIRDDYDKEFGRRNKVAEDLMPYITTKNPEGDVYESSTLATVRGLVLPEAVVSEGVAAAFKSDDNATESGLAKRVREGQGLETLGTDIAEAGGYKEGDWQHTAAWWTGIGASLLLPLDMGATDVLGAGAKAAKAGLRKVGALDTPLGITGELVHLKSLGAPQSLLDEVQAVARREGYLPEDIRSYVIARADELPEYKTVADTLAKLKKTITEAPLVETADLLDFAKKNLPTNEYEAFRKALAYIDTARGYVDSEGKAIRTVFKTVQEAKQFLEGDDNLAKIILDTDTSRNAVVKTISQRLVNDTVKENIVRAGITAPNLTFITSTVAVPTSQASRVLKIISESPVIELLNKKRIANDYVLTDRELELYNRIPKALRVAKENGVGRPILTQEALDQTLSNLTSYIAYHTPGAQTLREMESIFNRLGSSSPTATETLASPYVAGGGFLTEAEAKSWTTALSKVRLSNAITPQILRGEGFGRFYEYLQAFKLWAIGSDVSSPVTQYAQKTLVQRLDAIPQVFEAELKVILDELKASSPTTSTQELYRQAYAKLMVNESVSTTIVLDEDGRQLVIQSLEDGTRRVFYTSTGTGGGSAKGDWIPMSGIALVNGDPWYIKDAGKVIQPNSLEAKAVAGITLADRATVPMNTRMLSPLTYGDLSAGDLAHNAEVFATISKFNQWAYQHGAISEAVLAKDKLPGLNLSYDEARKSFPGLLPTKQVSVPDIDSSYKDFFVNYIAALYGAFDSTAEVLALRTGTRADLIPKAQIVKFLEDIYSREQGKLGELIHLYKLATTDTERVESLMAISKILSTRELSSFTEVPVELAMLKPKFSSDVYSVPLMVTYVARKQEEIAADINTQLMTEFDSFGPASKDIINQGIAILEARAARYGITLDPTETSDYVKASYINSLTNSYTSSSIPEHTGRHEWETYATSKLKEWDERVSSANGTTPNPDIKRISDRMTAIEVEKFQATEKIPRIMHPTNPKVFRRDPNHPDFPIMVAELRRLSAEHETLATELRRLKVADSAVQDSKVAAHYNEYEDIMNLLDIHPDPVYRTNTIGNILVYRTVGSTKRQLTITDQRAYISSLIRQQTTPTTGAYDVLEQASFVSPALVKTFRDSKVLDKASKLMAPFEAQSALRPLTQEEFTGLLARTQDGLQPLQKALADLNKTETGGVMAENISNWLYRFVFQTTPNYIKNSLLGGGLVFANPIYIMTNYITAPLIMGVTLNARKTKYTGIPVVGTVVDTAYNAGKAISEDMISAGLKTVGHVDKSASDFVQATENFVKEARGDAPDAPVRLFPVTFYMSELWHNRGVINTPSGRTYTPADIEAIKVKYDIASASREAEFSTDMLKKMLDYARQNFDSSQFAFAKHELLQAEKAIGLNGLSYWNDVAQQTDLAYRTRALVRALEEGSTVEQAVEVARKALYDYSELTEFEQNWVAKIVWFYRFNRQNLVQTVAAFIDNPSRVARMMKTQKLTVSKMFGSEDNPDVTKYRESSAFLGLIDGVDKERLAMYSPSMPLLESTSTLLDTMSLFYVLDADYGDELTKRALYRKLKDDYSADILLDTLAIGVRSKTGLELDWTTEDSAYLDPRLVAWLKMSGQWETFDIYMKVQKKPSMKEGETTFDGYVYSLPKESKVAWGYMTSAIKVVGFDRTLRDWATLQQLNIPEGTVLGDSVAHDPILDTLEFFGIVKVDSARTVQEVQTEQRRDKMNLLEERNK